MIRLLSLIATSIIVSFVSTVAQGIRWEVVAQMTVARHWHANELLHSGQLLIMGGVSESTKYVDGAGMDGYPTTSVDIYDPATRTITPAAQMRYARSQFPSVILQDGSVLVFGGMSVSAPRGECTDAIERYVPEVDQWIVVGHMSSPRRLHSAMLLDEDHVLVCGGALSNQKTVATTEIFEISTGITRVVSSMPQGLKEGSLARLPGNIPVYVGGRAGGPNSPRQENLLGFDYSTETWMVIPLNQDLPLLSQTVAINDRVLIGCGGNIAEAPARWSTGVFRVVDGEVDRFLELDAGRAAHAICGIGPGTVLVSGGLDEKLVPVISTLIIDAEYETILMQPDHVVPRGIHTLVKLEDSQQGLTMFAIGGITSDQTLTNTIEMLVVQSEGYLRSVSSVDEDAQHRVSFYPNPATREVVVSTTPGDLLIVTDIFGKVVTEVSVSESQHRLNVEHFISGRYCISLKSTEGIRTSAFVKF